MNNGWVRTYRKSLKSSVWIKPVIWWVWSWCLLKANHQQKKFPFAGKDIEIKEGQFITGIKVACKELKLTPKKYRNAINYLKNSKRITTKATNQFTIINVINWRKYQPLDYKKGKRIIIKRANGGQTEGKRRATNNNDKNNKKLSFPKLLKKYPKFNSFYSIYPKKKDGRTALKAFLKINPIPKLLTIILKDIEKKKKSEQWQRENGQYIPYPATYLNKQSWEDEEIKTANDGYRLR